SQSTHAAQSDRMAYWSSFMAIPADVHYRPPRMTAQPRIHGTMHAHIDGVGSDEYAEIDELGRYKVRLPLDVAGAARGQASQGIRMAQGYAGPNYGIHFPLHKGTEVLLTFIDGAVDRPIISAAVPNAATPSPVKAENHWDGLINTAGHHYLLMSDL